MALSRQLRLPNGFDQLKRSPLSLQGVLVEELDGTQRNLKGAGGNLLDLTEVEKILAQFFFTDPIWGLIVVSCQLPDYSHIVLLSTG